MAFLKLVIRLGNNQYKYVPLRNLHISLSCLDISLDIQPPENSGNKT